MAAIGAGYAWPSVAFWGEGQRITIFAKADPPGVMGPVRFLQSALAFIPAASFESAVDSLFDAVGTMLDGEDIAAFRALINALHDERNDVEISAWRRLEAINGFDPDDAPEELISSLLRLSERFSANDVEEAAAAYPGIGSAETLTKLVDDVSTKRFTSVNFDDAINRVGRIVPGDPREPWHMAEIAASRLRGGLGAGALLNRRFADLIAVDPNVFRSSSATGRVLPYGIRLSGSPTDQRVLLRARWSQDRRFELMRALGDAIWSYVSPLGPISRAGTARQKFQRAFAATMLCPLEELADYLGCVDPSDEDIAAAARHFHVSERVVRSVLVNKHLMDRNRLEIPEIVAPAGTPIEEIADAA